MNLPAPVCPFVPTRWLLVGLCVAAVLAGPAHAARPQHRKTTPPPPPPVNVQALRAAIEDLIATFGPRYPHGRQYLQRLQAAQDAGDQHALRDLQRQALLANPLVSGQPILFVVRRQYAADHHATATLFQTGEINARKFRGPAAIKTLDLAAGGKVTTLLEVPQGVARDPELDYDAKRLVFAMRRDARDDYHIYQMNIDGSALKQLTFGQGVSDIDPVYLPDGSIVFSATRDYKFCQCNRHIMANLYRMDNDGANIHQIGGSGLFEGHPHVLPDGRILYDRWEYVDRQFGPSFGLWTVNPDGTNPALFYGNNAWAPGMIADARSIPGTNLVVATFGSCHDRPWGALAVVDRNRGLDGSNPVLHLWPDSARKILSAYDNSRWQPGGIDAFKSVRPRYEDPYPLSDKYFLCSREIHNERMGLFLIDRFGNEILLHEEPQLGCYDPMPIAPRPRPPLLPRRTDPTADQGLFYVYDVYAGTAMDRVKRGTVKYLRIVEAPYKHNWTGPHWGIDATQAPAMNWNLVNNKRIIGDVPVEPDGSAFFTAPADRFIYFLALDQNKQMVQAMRSGTMVKGGEVTGCVGCHEYRHQAVPNSPRQAWQRPPSTPQPWFGPPRLFSYTAEVQPVFDRHCVACHDYGKPAGKVLNLAGDLGLVFNTSYLQLHRQSAVRWSPDPPGPPRLLVKAVHDGPPAVLPPYAWGSHRSRLLAYLQPDHYGVQLTSQEIQRIVTWIDLNTPYYPTYASAYPDHPFGRSPLTQAELDQLARLTGARFDAGSIRTHGPLLNFTRPRFSSALDRLDPADPRYAQALAIIRTGQQRLRQKPRADMPGFVPSGLDQWRLNKADALRRLELACRQAIAEGKKYYPKPSITPYNGAESK